MENELPKAPRTQTSVSIPVNLYLEYKDHAERIGMKAAQLIRTILEKNRKKIRLLRKVI